MNDTLQMSGRLEFKIYEKFESILLGAINLGLAKLSMHGEVFNRLHLHFLNKFGTVRDEWEVNNTVTDAGKAQVALLAGDAAATPFTYLAVGTSNTNPQADQTTLGAEITTNGLERAAATVSRVTTTVTNDTLQLVKTFTATGSHTVEEAGIFNASSAGTMLGRALTSTKTLISGETITVTYKVKMA